MYTVQCVKPSHVIFKGVTQIFQTDQILTFESAPYIYFLKKIIWLYSDPFFKAVTELIRKLGNFYILWSFQNI